MLKPFQSTISIYTLIKINFWTFSTKSYFKDSFNIKYFLQALIKCRVVEPF